MLIRYSGIIFHASDDVRTTGEWWQTDVQSQSLSSWLLSPSFQECWHAFPSNFFSSSLSVHVYVRASRPFPIFTTCHKQEISLASHEVVPLLGSSAFRLLSHDASSASRADDPVGPRAGVTGKTQRAEVLCYRRIPFNPRLESGKVQFDIFQTTLRLWFRFMHNLETRRSRDEPFWSSEICVRSFWVDSLVFSSNLSSVTPV